MSGLVRGIKAYEEHHGVLGAFVAFVSLKTVILSKIEK